MNTVNSNLNDDRSSVIIEDSSNNDGLRIALICFSIIALGLFSLMGAAIYYENNNSNSESYTEEEGADMVNKCVGKGGKPIIRMDDDGVYCLFLNVEDEA